MTDTNKNYSFGQQPTGCLHGGASLELKCTLCAEIALAYLRAENKKLRAVRVALQRLYDADMSMSSAGVSLASKHRATILDQHDAAMLAARAALDDAKEIK